MKTTFFQFVKNMSFIGIFLVSSHVFSQNTVSGNVTDTDGMPLLGANVIIKGTNTGSVTDMDGNFSIKTSENPPFVLNISSIGFETASINVAEVSTKLNVVLKEGNLLDEVIISASRRREKLQEAPAAVSVLSAKKLEDFALSNPVQALQNLTGVDVATYGIGEAKINLRGKSTVFQSETHIIVDYRNVSMPSLGQNKSGQNPVDAIDLERVEVIKGPGSALYGPGVEAGVVHFITKSPFSKQGLTLSVGAGNQSQFQSAFRWAQVSKNEKFGYKITGFQRYAENFGFTDDVSAARIATYGTEITSGVTGKTFDVEVPDLTTQSYGITGTLEYKPTDITTITSVLGYSTSEGIFRTAQGEGYQATPRPFAQLRVQSGGFFAQAFWSNQNPGEKSWLYGPGLTNYSDISQYEGQAQYNFDASEKLNLIVGADYKFNTIDSKGTINGRFEDNDDYSIYGAYVQGKYKLSDKLDLTAAGRVDQFVALDHTSFSPRLALVYKKSDNHTFRATYNQSTGAPIGVNLFTDLPIGAGPAGSAIWLTGGAEGISYNNNNAYSFITQSAVPSTDFPLAALYNLVAPAFAGSPLEPAIAAIGSQVTGTTGATVFSTPLSRGALVPSTSKQIEVGYVGRPSDKLRITIDAYYNQRNNNVTSTVVSNSFYGYATAGSDLAAEITAINPAVAGIVLASGATVAQTFAGGINGTTLNPETGAPNPLGVLSADQSPANAFDITYFNIESIDYLGADLGLDYYASDDVSFNGSISWLSNAYWEEVAVQGTDQKVPFSLNVPEFRAKVSANYTPAKGFNANLAARYRGEFEANNGLVFTGTTEASTLLDLSLGYTFSPNYKLKLTVSNLTDVQYRPIANAPLTGRAILGQFTIHLD
jgi:iron complex outermembrane receptor protein